MPEENTPYWRLYQGDREERSIEAKDLPGAPPWRQFRSEPQATAEQQSLKGETFQAPDEAIEMVNAAISLRRPLLITGDPGTGKSTLAYAVARELGLGPVLKWAITTRTTLRDGLYSYDAIARLQDAQLADRQKDDDVMTRLQDAMARDPKMSLNDALAATVDRTKRQPIGEYITLGPLGTAFLPHDLPKVLLIDEIDKSDIDLPNDLLNLFEDGEFPIPELQRDKGSEITVRRFDRDEHDKQKTADIKNGIVRCSQFPLVIMTSNGERDFPPPFLRRCLRLRMPNPDVAELQKIVTSHFDAAATKQAEELIQTFYDRVKAKEMIATDQLLNAIHMRALGNSRDEELEKRLLQNLNGLGDE